MTTETRNDLLAAAGIISFIAFLAYMLILGIKSESEPTHIRQYQKCLEVTDGNKEYCGWTEK